MRHLLVPSVLRLADDDERLRSRIRAWIADHDPAVQDLDYDVRFEALLAWQHDLHAAGFVGLSWPEPYGAGLGLSSEVVLAEELAASSLPELINRLAVYTWGPTLIDHGTDEQRRRLLPGMLDATELWCQGFSEPEAGSDLSAVRTIARRDGDVFRVTGQKVWTSRAERSRWCALLARTDPDAQRHRGLTVLILDLTRPGVTVRPLRQIVGHPHFSEVFLDDVEVPVADVLGEVDDGWRIAMAAMAYERGLFVLERQIRLRRRLDDLVDELDRRGSTAYRLAELGRISAELIVLESKVLRTLAEQSEGTLAPGATSVDKLFLAEVYQDLFSTAFDALAPEGVVAGGWRDDLLESRSVSIYSGTSEIQREVIVRQLLGVRP